MMKSRCGMPARECEIGPDDIDETAGSTFHRDETLVKLRRMP